MIKEIIIENYRGYRKHTIEFTDLNIVVGKNNAGKTTLIEALRLISLVTKRYKKSAYQNVPKWLHIAKVNSGISISLNRIDFSYKNIFHSYSEPPSIIQASFNNGTKIIIYFGGEQKFHVVLFDNESKICNKENVKRLELPILNILPQISPLLAEENVLNEDYVKLNIDSQTSSRHFRNQLGYFSEYYEKFKNLIETTWDGIKLLEYNKGDKLYQESPYLLIQEEAFTTEIGNMGHGLQMWMQTIWFLAKCQSDSTVILDEPDVYMHADLQRKLIRFLRSEFSQVIIATHSIEIMSEVEPENIVIIDKKKLKSSFASDFNAVQKALLTIGSIHNIGLARLWSANKLIIVEGKDIDILKRIQNILFPKSNQPFDTIPNISIGGWGGWNRAIGSKLMLKNAGEENIVTYCILDSDYHTTEEILEKKEQAKKNNISLKIWKRKEIENYLIIPTAIKRIIEKNSNFKIEINEIEIKIENLIDSLKDEYADLLMDKIHTEARKSGKSIEPSTAKKEANEILKIDWKNKYDIVSGKTLLKMISNWTNDEFNVNINSNKLTQELTITEIPIELKQVVTKIENREKF